jgi:hypothetical protein
VKELSRYPQSSSQTSSSTPLALIALQEQILYQLAYVELAFLYKSTVARVADRNRYAKQFFFLSIFAFHGHERPGSHPLPFFNRQKEARFEWLGH